MSFVEFLILVMNDSALNLKTEKDLFNSTFLLNSSNLMKEFDFIDLKHVLKNTVVLLEMNHLL